MIPSTPLTQAIKVTYASSSRNEKVYQGTVNKDWSVGKVPNGGFSLGLLLEACIQYQSPSIHPDPINVSAHYLQTVQTAAFEVRVRKLKTGRGFSNVVADLVQKDRTKITAHVVFGILAPLPTSPGPSLTLSPPSPYARRHPLHTHPSNATPEPLRSTWGFSAMTRWAPDPAYSERNKIDSPNRTNSTTVGGGGVEWAAWFQLTNENDAITMPALCMFADIFQNLPLLLPKSERDGLSTSWFPTMVLNIDFKFPIPRPSSDYASRTIGIYSSGHFINDPQGRHNQYTEVWTAPCNLGEGGVEDGWRDRQVCLATSTQMALVIPMEVNHQRAKL